MILPLLNKLFLTRKNLLNNLSNLIAEQHLALCDLAFWQSQQDKRKGRDWHWRHIDDRIRSTVSRNCFSRKSNDHKFNLRII